jgi:uncharacterized protein
MIRSTFLHMPSIGKSTEDYLWQKGVLTWDDFLEKHTCLNLSQTKTSAILSNISLSQEAHESGDHAFFSTRLAQKDHWRAYPDFRRICYLDIETTGLSPYFSDITLIGLYNGKESQFFIKGKNLTEFPEEVKAYSTIVSFNGRAFDLPFIQTKFPDLRFDQFHIDLRYALARLGYRGGLKAIEPQLGLIRPDEVQGVDGFEAVRLWRRYERGDKSALDKLIAYNKEDIENLKPLAEFAYPRLEKIEFSGVRAADRND